MAPPSPPIKRQASASISPPPIKRKVQSGTTQNAVSSFFTPKSQKPKDRTIWTERSPSEDVPATLIVGRYQPETAEERTRPRRKIAAFDLDSTLITTSSGKKHASGVADWKWWHSQVPGRLRELYKDEGYRVVILSNQAGISLHPDPKSKGPKADPKKRVTDFKQKCSAILNNLDLPTSLYAATEKDKYRKPGNGMWKELCDDYDIPVEEVDLKESFFVGDAAGRIAVHKDSNGVAAAKDFSCSDRNFAHHVGIDFKTPEEFFLGEKPRKFVRDFDLAEHPFVKPETSVSDTLFEKTNDQDIVIFCGPPGSGKSTFHAKYMKHLGYERVNQDTLKTRDKCVKVAKEHLANGKSVAVDNTNADPETRAVWIAIARECSIPIRCLWFRTPLTLCEHNDAVRARHQSLNPETRSNLPKVAFTGFASRFKEPQAKEGFQDVSEIPFSFRGSQDDYELWGRYWL